MKAKQYKVTITLIGNQKPCNCGQQVGQQWVYDYYQTPPGICSWAWNSIYPVALAFASGGTFHWQKEPDVITVCCPDAEVVNVFELRRTLKGPGEQQ